MSDARLRELERRWRETGERADEVALLAERVRAGHLERRDLALAAHLGHAAAAELVDLAPTPPLTRARLYRYLQGWERGPPEWLVRLQTLGGDDAVRRLAVAVVRRAPGDAAEAAAAVEAWLDAPSAGASAAVRAHRTGPRRLIRAVAGLVLDPDDRPVEGGRLLDRAAGLLLLAVQRYPGPALDGAAAEVATRALGTAP